MELSHFCLLKTELYASSQAKSILSPELYALMLGVEMLMDFYKDFTVEKNKFRICIKSLEIFFRLYIPNDYINYYLAI